MLLAKQNIFENATLTKLIVAKLYIFNNLVQFKVKMLA